MLEVVKEVVQHQKQNPVGLSHELADHHLELPSHKLRTRTRISLRTCNALEKSSKTYRLARKDSFDWGLLTALRNR